MVSVTVGQREQAFCAAIQCDINNNLEQLYSIYSRALKAFIYGVCNVGEPQLANSLMQGWKAC